MQKTRVFVIAACCAVMSCTVDKADYEAETGHSDTDHYEFKEVTALQSENHTISIEALNGLLYKGYNEIRLKIDGGGNTTNISEVSFLPIMTTAEEEVSCPHRYLLEYNDEGYFSGYAVFTHESSQGNWELYIGFSADGEAYQASAPVTVEEQPNKNLNMTSFTGNDGYQYVIALVAPRKPEVAENNLVAGIYKYDQPAGTVGTLPDPSQFSYSEASNYTLQIDPRMPEPSMGNHSSPNNVDLVQEDDKLYHGVVNYTMTGNWTLNFIMVDGNGRIIKGTEVSTDFTPGVEGAKSELFIDILF
ncbi:hypothetical protein [Sinomicrobium soli]|uniref:hypothetical protein n=1 Tax=Sinomicrobium sp. N-1-3-6 TaxID=2219864 RepID=UPI000DCBA96F|nr:hypothetical protein [Sinomicrobium sp. N-1-3-6]RAV30576.1 hypothetical protein DN748_03520 [Sinomicrobium sp. N-1-3-6]